VGVCVNGWAIEFEDKVKMTMRIETKEADGVTVVSVGGRIALGQNEETMRESIRVLLEDGRKAIVLDLGDVTFMDSSGLAELITAHVAAKGTMPRSGWQT